MAGDFIEEVMQQKAPGVPDNIKLQQPHTSSNPQGVRKRLSANFFKATFSSRNKAVSTAVSSRSVEETTKIGSAETKPITRNRPRSVSQLEETKSKAKKGIERSKPVNRFDKPPCPERPLRAKQLTPEPSDHKTASEQKSQHDLKSANVVFQIVKKSVTPKQSAPKTPDSILPPTLKPRLPEKTKLKLNKLINNNNVWSNANIEKSKITQLTPSRGQQGKQEPALKGAPSVSSLDSKHKVAPSRDKTLKIFGSKEKLHKAHKKKDLGNNNAVLEDPELREVLEYEDGQVREYGSAEELGSVGDRGSQECVSLPVMLNADHMPGFQEVELRPRIPSEASLGSGVRETEALRRELEACSAERAQLQARLHQLEQRAAEADALSAELHRLKAAEAEREAAMERLADENGALRARLRGVAHSPLSDSEKRQLLLAPAPRRMHSSAPASIALAHNVRICNVAACSEKRQLLLAPRRMHSSAPASIALAHNREAAAAAGAAPRRMHFFAPASIALAHNVRICNVAACSEKRQLLLAPAPRRMHSSAPASIALAHNVRICNVAACSEKRQLLLAPRRAACTPPRPPPSRWRTTYVSVMLQPAARSGSCCSAPRRMHSSAPASIALAHNVRICNVAACSEKRQLLPAPRRMHSSAPASIALAHNVRICNVAACSEKRQLLLAGAAPHALLRARLHRAGAQRTYL
ncbi:unnamed protein product [Parnassius apollo]|uniref:(apollo) hypothetical protein n=1 Tax=Parnassius apollo TaxID=110799 RepID=A0A8S3Y4D8_PARAO|nr:unnamed protein product [Parnassius apollo]